MNLFDRQKKVSDFFEDHTIGTVFFSVIGNTRAIADREVLLQVGLFPSYSMKRHY